MRLEWFQLQYRAPCCACLAGRVPSAARRRPCCACCTSLLYDPSPGGPFALYVQQQTVGQLLAHVRQLCDRLEAQAEVSYVQADGTKVGLGGPMD